MLFFWTLIMAGFCFLNYKNYKVNGTYLSLLACVLCGLATVMNVVNLLIS